MANYLYNGIELPELPEWDKDTYPYACIVRPRAGDDNMRILIVSAASFIVEVRVGYGTNIEFGVLLDNGVPAKRTESISIADNPLSWGEIAYDYTYSYGVALGEHVILWSNTDVFDEDGEVFMEGTDPVPVGVLTLTASDLYKKVNGQLVKHTLYKKIGGVLVKVDEYTI